MNPAHKFKKFLNDPKRHKTGEHIYGRAVWVLDEALYWMTQDGATHAESAGYKWDGWSCPRFLQWFVRKIIKYPLDALLHDRGYEGNLKGWTRREVDRLLLDVPRWAVHDRTDSVEAWAAVRVCALWLWRKHRVSKTLIK